MIVSMIVLFGYLVYVVAKFGIPQSISDTFYLLGKKGWMFQVALAATAFCVVPSLIDASTENTQFLAFFGCAGLAFVAFAPLFKMELEGKVHFVSAYFCCGSLCLWQVFNTSWLIPVVCLALVAIPMVKDKKYMWWLEIATIVSALVSMWMKV